MCYANLQLSQHAWVSTKNGDFNSYLDRFLKMKAEKSGNWQPDTITMTEGMPLGFNIQKHVAIIEIINFNMTFQAEILL